jgi:response regulator RpfG family c-di-GMP phosphodiesterase
MRKKGINVLSIDESSDLVEVSFVIIDLKYEDDKAYEILNTINNNQKLSQMNVFVVVRTRNELNKLSILQNIRIIDYLSASIKPEECLEINISSIKKYV